MTDKTPRIRRRLAGAAWIRRYPPLATFAVVLIIMLVIMPSALNLPQANPSTVLEYAPVPPEKNENPPPQTGSLSSLSLGSSNTLSAGSTPPKPKTLSAGGKGTSPTTKQCVGNPPRQTEDPNAPPCVPFFSGDNGGATYQGVTKDEITVLIYTSTPTTTGTDNPPEDSPAAGTYCDVDAKPDSNTDCLDQAGGQHDFGQQRQARALVKSFNQRFQTYGRHVHLWMYYSSNAQTPSSRRSDANDNWETLHPYAVIDYAFFGGYNDVYAEAMTRRRITVISNFSAQPNKLYRENAPFLWTFWPDVEHWADQYYTYLCDKVIPFKVSHSGNSGDQAKPRRYGLLSTSNDGYPGLKLFAKIVTDKLKAGPCPNGAKADVAGSWYFPGAQFSVDDDPDATTAANQNVAEMQSKSPPVTTVLVLGGTESEHGKAMKTTNWFPEIVLAGDLQSDKADPPTYEDQDAWRHAWIVSNQLREDKRQDVPCKNAYRESDPFGTNDDESGACDIYRAMFMLFRSIQVAGPFLTPDAVDQGNHSVPRIASNDPYTAACFFDSNDYSCVKDAQEEWWDPDAPYPGTPSTSSGNRGCWKMVNGGKRYLSGTWEGTDQDVFKNPSDPCNNVQGPTYVQV